MNEIVEKEEIKVENLIYEVRGKYVMLDRDLARLYQCANGTKAINLAVKRHIGRFPERFMFQLTKEELSRLRFQFETATNYNKSRTLPYAFTEEGVAMLATVLRTSVAETVSIAIMDAFVAMKKYISNELLEQKYMKDMLLKHDNKLDILDNRVLLLQESFDKMQNKELINEIYFEGQIYDAYSKILDIISKATKEVIIIDNYADKTILDMISRLKIKVILITRKNNLLTETDIEKYKKQYNNLTIKYDSTFHDRYIILDKEKVYHLGSSINHIGSRTFSINILQEKEIINSLLEKVGKIK